MKRICFAAGVWVVAVAAVAVPAQSPKSVNEGVYTEAQADRGATVFKTTCTACHDAARFTGDEFLAGWTGKSLHALFDQMVTTMPEDNPGSLKPQQYADVVAYFLKLNGYPAGKVELSGPEAMKGITFDKKTK